MLVVGILSQKLSVPATAGSPVEVVIGLVYVMIAVFFAMGKARIDRLVLILLLLFFTGATITSLLNPSSLPSLLYVFAIYLPLSVQIEMSRKSYERLLRCFQILVMFSAQMVLIDWLFQLFGKPMPNFEHIIPEPIRYYHFNYIQPLDWGSRWYKPNGFFFLEVSYLAQFIATGLIFEICYFRRLAHLGLMSLAMILCFSGTGFLLLIASAPVILAHLKPKLVVVAIVLMPAAIITASSVGVLDNASQRTEDFGKDGSSANQRFVKQYAVLPYYLTSHENAALIGIGAGQMPKEQDVIWTPVTKVIAEYGIPVALLYFTVLCTAIFRNGTPFAVGYVMLVQFLFLNGGFLVPVNVFLFFVLATLVRISNAPSTSAARVEWFSDPPNRSRLSGSPSCQDPAALAPRR